MYSISRFTRHAQREMVEESSCFVKIMCMCVLPCACMCVYDMCCAYAYAVCYTVCCVCMQALQLLQECGHDVQRAIDVVQEKGLTAGKY